MSNKKINIVRKTGDFCSWYEDENNILKGEWGGFEETDETGEKGEKEYLIY